MGGKNDLTNPDQTKTKPSSSVRFYKKKINDFGS